PHTPHSEKGPGKGSRKPDRFPNPGHLALTPFRCLTMIRLAQQAISLNRVSMTNESYAPRPSRLSAEGMCRGWRALAAWWSPVEFAGSSAAPVVSVSRVWGPLLLLLAALLLFPKLNRPLLDPDEGRQAEVAREMLAHGDLTLPRLRGLPYLEKPPLQ